MGLKLSYGSQLETAKKSLLDASAECCDIYQKMIEKGYECKEIEDIVCTIQMIRDTVSTSGVRAFHYRMDKDNQFATMYNCTPYESGMGLEYAAHLKTEYIAAAEEGLRAWWIKFVEALKNMLVHFTTWVQLQMSSRMHDETAVRESSADLTKINIETSISSLSYTSAMAILKAANDIHEAFRQLASNQTIDDHFVVVKKIYDVCHESLLRIGYQFDKETLDDNSFRIRGISECVPDGFDACCPVESKTLAAHGFTADGAKTLIEGLKKIESAKDFRNTSKKVEDIIRNFITSSEKKLNDANKPAADGSSTPVDNSVIVVGMIKDANAVIRVCCKMVSLENKLATKLLKTAFKIQGCCKN